MKQRKKDFDLLNTFLERIKQISNKELKKFNNKTALDLNATLYPDGCWVIECGIKKVECKGGIWIHDTKKKGF